MFKNILGASLRQAALALMLAASSGLAVADTIHVDINTADFGAATGYLDLQLSASTGVVVPLTTALVSNMVGFDPSAFIDSWGVTPSSGGYLFRNDTSNDLFHAVAFGGVLSFDLTFDSAYDPLTRYVSHFLVGAFGEDFAPLGNYDPLRGSLLDISWTPSVTAADNGSMNLDVADSNAVTVVPEPSDILLIGVALAAMALVARRRRVPGAAQAV